VLLAVSSEVPQGSAGLRPALQVVAYDTEGAIDGALSVPKLAECKFASTELTWATMTRYVGNSSLPVVLAHRRSPSEDFDTGRSFEP
jgi:hypothetical protein